MHVGVGGVGRGQPDHGLDTLSNGRTGGEMPHRARLYLPGDKETRKRVPLWCLGLGFGVYKTIARLGLGHGGRAKGTFQLEVGPAPF